MQVLSPVSLTAPLIGIFLNITRLILLMKQKPLSVIALILSIIPLSFVIFLYFNEKYRFFSTFLLIPIFILVIFIVESVIALILTKESKEIKIGSYLIIISILVQIATMLITYLLIKIRFDFGPEQIGLILIFPPLFLSFVTIVVGTIFTFTGLIEKE